ncbi:hypothetical protein LTR10_024280 [Elasticomyces elasticus]|uniref:Uncharacterized protein n=1 Tax=Exophiala sideris TaxID=1016849 RepID=A0ABR0J4P7_9EURO|nr:hypothetical protein LTR10_024280 [Elasticomyces elasticus]KAK5026827.1 hypothetical protein LTS07_007125 [Exophiala sideris]KAK5033831.1 hypothetical protein LTR13_006430 [Exophiala sideris]KAK5055895.1 hypothetical protein LTR69_008271 [Exophiala sideris]KAK5176013.1 hypothetical protein LTR44_011428 [Eurotiomycetes sp. CCFEE 6388]
MVGRKRPSSTTNDEDTDSSARPSKQAKVSATTTDVNSILALKKAELAEKSQSELVSLILTLQKHIASGDTVEPNLSAEKVLEKAQSARKQMIKNVKAQLKWKPTAKIGSAKWSYSGTVANEQVFLKLFGLPAFKGKQTKLPRKTFNALTDEEVSASVRYDTLYVTGDHVRLPM